MGVTGVLAKLAVHQPHVLALEVPHHWRVRVAVERWIRERGWVLAASPADADILAVCGAPNADLFSALELVWRQMPGPRVRADVHSVEDVDRALSAAHEQLADTGRHRVDARERRAAMESPAEHGLVNEDGRDNDGAMTPGDHGQMDHGQMDHGQMDHGQMDHGQMDHGEMGHDMMDHDMAPGGIPLAQGGNDRDGLEMDVLNVALGPLLTYWPAGVALRCVMQGDVLTAVEVELFTEAPLPRRGDPWAVHARTLDNVVSLLTLAGWESASAEARRIRDSLLVGPGHVDTGAAHAALRRLRRKVRRSFVLRWSLRGLCRVSAEDAERLGISQRHAGDCHDRLLAMLERVHEPPTPDADPVAAEGFPVGALAPLVTGLDLAAARLVIASLDLHDLHADRPTVAVAHV